MVPDAQIPVVVPALVHGGAGHHPHSQVIHTGLLPLGKMQWGNFVKSPALGISKSFIWLPWLSAFRFLLILDVLVQLNGAHNGMVIIVITFILFVGSRYSRLSIKPIIHMHFHVLCAYILVHLTGESKKPVPSGKLKCKGVNKHFPFKKACFINMCFVQN